MEVQLQTDVVVSRAVVTSRARVRVSTLPNGWTVNSLQCLPVGVLFLVIYQFITTFNLQNAQLFFFTHQLFNIVLNLGSLDFRTLLYYELTSTPLHCK